MLFTGRQFRVGQTAEGNLGSERRLEAAPRGTQPVLISDLLLREGITPETE